MTPKKYEFIVLQDGINDTSEAQRGEHIFYLCLVCEAILPSSHEKGGRSYGSPCCACGNISIDFEWVRLHVGDYKKIQVLKKLKNPLFEVK